MTDPRTTSDDPIAGAGPTDTEDTEAHGRGRGLTDAGPIEADDAPTGDEDTEGHSLSLLLGMNAMDRARAAERSRPRVPEEDPARPVNAPSGKKDARR